MSCASLWTALHVVYDIAVWFCSGRCSKIRSSSYESSSSSMLWSSLLLYAMLSGFFGIVRRQRGRVVRPPDLTSVGRGFKSRSDH